MELHPLNGKQTTDSMREQHISMKKMMRSIAKRTGILWYCLMLSFPCIYADSYSGAEPDEAEILRIPVWVFLEPQPGVMDNDVQGTVLPPRTAIIELSKTLMEGMIYGWKFTYTPVDKQRQVAEAFELTPLHTIAHDDSRLSLTDVRIEYPSVYCWAEYRIPDPLRKRRQEWTRIPAATAKGRGSASRKQEIDGIRDAYREAALNALHSYLRKNLKNKPKEVSGEMLIRNNPRLYTAGGKFHAELNVYLRINEVIPYEIF